MSPPFHLTTERSLHFFYGVNCYQFAREQLTPIVIKEENAQHVVLSYVNVFPGNLSTSREVLALSASPDRDLKGLVNLVIRGCGEDSLIDCGSNFEIRSGYRTLAVLFKEADFDFHFAKYENGVWASKTPLDIIRRYGDIQALERDTGYAFHAYLLAPERTVPGMIKSLSFTERVVHTSEGKAVSLKEVPVSVAVQEILPAKTALRIDKSTGKTIYIRNRLAVPTPPWPSVPGGTLVRQASDTTQEILRGQLQELKPSISTLPSLTGPYFTKPVSVKKIIIPLRLPTDPK